MSPVTKSDFSNANTGAPLCDQFREKLLNNGKLALLMEYLFNDNGTPSASFTTDMLPFLPKVGSMHHFPYPLTDADPGDGNGPVYLLCDGTKKTQADYALLYSYLGQQAAGEGPNAGLDAMDAATEFRLPYMAGKFPLGQDVGGGHAAGEIAGEATHVLTIPEMPAHTHGLTPASGALVGGSGLIFGNAISGAPATASTGGGGSHNNMPPYRTGLWYILAGFKNSGVLIGNA